MKFMIMTILLTLSFQTYAADKTLSYDDYKVASDAFVEACPGSTLMLFKEKKAENPERKLKIENAEAHGFDAGSFWIAIEHPTDDTASVSIGVVVDPAKKTCVIMAE